MPSQKNTPELWDNIWNRSTSKAEDEYYLAKAEHSIRWARLQKRVLDHFGSFQGLSVVEIGAGRGIYAALFGKRGANVSVMDYSPAALERSQQFFSRFDLKAETIEANALAPPENMLNRYDVAISFGLTEHFLDDDRIQINKTHFDVAKPGGMVFIAVPHRNNPPYRIFKFLSERTGRWGVGEEYPYNRSEMRSVCQQIGVTNYHFFGESFFESFHFFNPRTKRLFRDALRLKPRDFAMEKSKLQPQKGSWLDTAFSYSLVLCGIKDSNQGLSRAA